MNETEENVRHCEHCGHEIGRYTIAYNDDGDELCSDCWFDNECQKMMDGDE